MLGRTMKETAARIPAMAPTDSMFQRRKNVSVHNGIPTANKASTHAMIASHRAIRPRFEMGWLIVLDWTSARPI